MENGGGEGRLMGGGRVGWGEMGWDPMAGLFAFAVDGKVDEFPGAQGRVVGDIDEEGQAGVDE